MIARVVIRVLDLALLVLIALAAFLLRAPAIDAAMADIPTDDWDQHCDQACQLGNDIDPLDEVAEADLALWSIENGWATA